MFEYLRSGLRVFAAWTAIAALALIACSTHANGDDAERKKAEAQKTVDEVTNEIDRSKEPSPGLYEERGDAFTVLGNFEKAFEDYSKAIAITPRRESTFFLVQKRIPVACEIGDYRLALADAQGATRVMLSPPHAEPYAILAFVLARSPDEKVKNAKAALEAAERAANMDAPNKNEVLVERALAAAYSVNGDFKAAVVHQEKAIAAVKGNLPSDMKAELDAYKSEREYPFQKRKPQ